ncbi:MAG: hypothetical protein AAGB22_10055 [Bacteroidota bacterium]
MVPAVIIGAMAGAGLILLDWLVQHYAYLIPQWQRVTPAAQRWFFLMCQFLLPAISQQVVIRKRGINSNYLTSLCLGLVSGIGCTVAIIITLYLRSDFGAFSDLRVFLLMISWPYWLGSALFALVLPRPRSATPRTDGSGILDDPGGGDH